MKTWLVAKRTRATKWLGVAALTVLILGVVAGTVAPAASAADPYVVDIQECARNGGQATAPAGLPVSVQNLAFVTGTYGLMKDFLLKQTTSKGIFRNGTLTIVDATDAWSNPELIGTGPARLGWLTRLPNVELDLLASGETVGVAFVVTLSGPVEIAFPPVGLTKFGPFHLRAGDELFQGCFITGA